MPSNLNSRFTSASLPTLSSSFRFRFRRTVFPEGRVGFGNKCSGRGLWNDGGAESKSSSNSPSSLAILKCASLCLSEYRPCLMTSWRLQSASFPWVNVLVKGTSTIEWARDFPPMSVVFQFFVSPEKICPLRV